MTQYGFAFLGTYCSGCKTCMLACKDYYDLTVDVNYRKVFEVGGGETVLDDDGSIRSTSFGYYVSSNCNHCADPACVKVCPTGAMNKDEDTGLVTVDARCIGCGYCAMSCPYKCPTVDREKGHSVKCTGCMDRVKEGELPICVEACPQRALVFGEISSLRDKYGDVDEVAPLPAARFTHPNLVVVKPVHALAPYSSGVQILNMNEVM